RCQGAGCGAFAEMATAAGTAYSDTGVMVGTSYTYRVRATDAAGNLGTYSPLASAVTSSPTPSVNPQGGSLLAAYTFEEGSGASTADVSGNAHVGSLVNGPIWTTGKYGSALSFNGLKSVVSAGNATSLNNVNTFTHCAWVFPRGRGGDNDARILHKGSATARKQLQTDSSLVNSLKLRVDRAVTSAE